MESGRCEADFGVEVPFFSNQIFENLTRLNLKVEITLFSWPHSINFDRICKSCCVEIFLGIQLLLLGIFAGLLGGILGLGGGVVFVLILPSIFAHLGVQPNEIVAYSIGNSLFATLFTSLSGNLKQIADKNFYLRPVLIISLPGVFMAYFLLHFFVHSLHYSKPVFNVVFLVLLVALLY